MLLGLYLQRVSGIHYFTLLRVAEPQQLKIAPEKQSKTLNSSRGAVPWMVTDSPCLQVTKAAIAVVTVVLIKTL